MEQHDRRAAGGLPSDNNGSRQSAVGLPLRPLKCCFLSFLFLLSLLSNRFFSSRKEETAAHSASALHAVCIDVLYVFNQKGPGGGVARQVWGDGNGQAVAAGSKWRKGGPRCRPRHFGSSALG